MQPKMIKTKPYDFIFLYEHLCTLLHLGNYITDFVGTLSALTSEDL